MIDPVIFTIEIGNFSFSLYWYGVLVMLGVAVAAWLATKEFKRRGEDPDYVWDSLLWLLPAGVIGSRLWYVVNVTLGGDSRYLQNPLTILNLKEGGLHYFGALLFGAIAFYLYARKMGLDFWLALDSIAPGLLLGQAIARPANFINQELYGQPTTLPWGIKIDAQHRMPPWNDLSRYPVETTRFHPTFAYEMLFNFLATGILIYLTRKYKEKIKPGVAFGVWLILAGVGRNIIEFFRPDQPTFPGTAFSYSRFVAILMVLAGVLLLLIKYRVLKIGFIPAGEDEYTIAPPLEQQLQGKKAQNNKLNNSSSDEDTQ
ncbi:MAG: prolipoprotein diacylglyceryl transferase [Chloroflexota bacterium]|jgi:phosphatidylglycerol:prolipoprotein diacylglycerol transferase|nr:prolipoprotein diacylglyceryl transferase [Chloroflexota bacterium]